MFLGHVAVGLAAKKAAPKASLLWLVGAPTLLDLLWPVFLYSRTTKSLDATGRWSFAAFVALLAVLYVGNVFGPPPPSVDALNAFAFAGFLIPVWAGWFDRHRTAPEEEGMRPCAR